MANGGARVMLRAYVKTQVIRWMGSRVYKHYWGS